LFIVFGFLSIALNANAGAPLFFSQTEISEFSLIAPFQEISDYRKNLLDINAIKKQKFDGTLSFKENGQVHLV
jgi:hypothetical protein